ncbi:cell division protein FtsZ [Aquabacterium sp. OR-4]|uniref:cell division protein FtsZ n=1 Tax=Aquabacterium sp. OR-4 TaxID=2978127 RepID=UPI0021B2BCA6|nr:cell division protein FtsZ [Aquabacterium sp. OR-4]MDT7834884.1 cell division protein FtsZ [Aquabacterium sp. OR-4]
MSFGLMEGLAIAAGVVLAGVVAHGVWSARKATPRQAEGAGDSRLEPVMGGAAAVTRAPDDAAADAAEAEGAMQALAELRPAVVPRKTARLDPLIDAIAMLRLESPVTGELALMHLPPTRRAGTKPFLIEGLSTDSGEFELPAPGRRYTEFQAGVQLANRSGALNEIEYSEFVQKLQGFAESVGAMVDLPDMLEVVGHARELDAFASAHDAQLAVVLRANDAAWTVGYLQQAAGRHGFVPGVLPGRLVLPGAEDGAPPVLVLGFDAQAALADDPNVAAVRSVTLSLDVPQTAEATEPYPAWQDAARRLAAEIDATVCDDAGRAITLQAFVGIGEDLKVLYQALEQRDLAAGSAAARRLFS